MTLKAKIHPVDIRNKIDLDDISQVEHWCKRLDCSPIELRNVVLERGRAVMDFQVAVAAQRPFNR